METSFAILFYSTQQYLIVLLNLVLPTEYTVDLVVLHVHAKFSTKFRATTTAVLPVLNLVLNLVLLNLVHSTAVSRGNL